MIDKVQKIREEVERLQIELIQEKENGFGSDVDDAYLKDICDTKQELEKQGEQNPYSGVSFKYNGHTFGMCARDGGAEILMDGNLKVFISLDKSFVYPIHPQPELAPKSALETIKEEKVNNANKVEPKFKVKYAGSEYNVFETKDIAGVPFYGIEDEPNHIDYVKADNCEIINDGIKEGNFSIPTKPVMFSEQKPTWSEEDEKEVAVLEAYIRSKDWSERHIDRALGIVEELVNKAKSLRPQKQWKPSKEQMEALWNVYEGGEKQSALASLYNDLKKL